MFHTTQSVRTTFQILNEMCMEEHTCDLKLPDNNRKCCLKGRIAGSSGGEGRGSSGGNLPVTVPLLVWVHRSRIDALVVGPLLPVI